MSKNIMYLKSNQYLPKRQQSHSPVPQKPAEKFKPAKSILPERTPHKKIQNQEQSHYRITQKKHLQTQNSNLSLQKIIEQNRCLMAQNSQLNQIISERSKIIIALQKKLEQQITQEVLTLQEIDRQKNKFIQDFNRKNRDNVYQIKFLEQQLENQHRQKQQLESIKNDQIEMLKSHLLRENRKNVENLNVNHARNNQLMDIQLNKLSAIIEARNDQIQALTINWKEQNQRYKNQIDDLVSQLDNISHAKRIELSQQKIYFQNQILQIQKEMSQSMEQTKKLYEAEIMKFKNLLNCKHIEANQMDQQVKTARIENDIKAQQMFEKEQILKRQIEAVQEFYKRSHFNEIQKVKNISHSETQILEKSNINNESLWRLENIKLNQLTQKKNQEIKSLYNQINALRQQYNLEVSKFEAIVQELKNKLVFVETSNKEEEELLKIKMAELRNADLNTLKQFYQNQLALKNQQLLNQQSILKQTRQKLHIQLQQKAQTNKKHDYQLDQLKIKISQLQLNAEIRHHEQKHQVSDLGQHVELTSMALIRQSQQKQRANQFNETQKNKFRQLIENKDIQIEQLQKKIIILKSNHLSETENLKKQIQIVNKTNQNLNSQIKREKAFYEKEIAKKDLQSKENRQFYETQMQKIKKESSDEFKKTVEELSHEKKQLEIEIKKLLTVQKNLQGQLNRFMQHKEQLQMQRNISHNQEKNRLTFSKQSLEINLKTYYEKKLESCYKQINLLQQQLAQKEADIRSYSQKNYKLQKKLAKLMESQERLRDVQEKVLAMGQENNLVKNLSQLIKVRQNSRK